MTQRLISPDERILDGKTGAVRLYFPDESVAPSGRYTMRGGICWPTEVKDEDRQVYGYAVLCGRNEESGRIYVFEERRYNLLEPFRDETTQTACFPALAPWMLNNWAKYLAYIYFVNQPVLTVHYWRSQILKSKTLTPKPVILEAEWSDSSAARVLLADLAERNMLVMASGRGVYESMGLMEGCEGLPERPALLALTCACAGLARTQTREAARVAA